MDSNKTLMPPPKPVDIAQVYLKNHRHTLDKLLEQSFQEETYWQKRAFNRLQLIHQSDPQHQRPSTRIMFNEPPLR